MDWAPSTDIFLSCITGHDEFVESAYVFFKNKVECGAVYFLLFCLEADVACGESGATLDGNVISTVDIGYNGVLGVVFLHDGHADKGFAFHILHTTGDFQDFGITRH